MSDEPAHPPSMRPSTHRSDSFGVDLAKRSRLFKQYQRFASQLTYIRPLFPIEGLDRVAVGIVVESLEPSCQPVKGALTRSGQHLGRPSAAMPATCHRTS